MVPELAHTVWERGGIRFAAEKLLKMLALSGNPMLHYACMRMR